MLVKLLRLGCLLHGLRDAAELAKQFVSLLAKPIQNGAADNSHENMIVKSASHQARWQASSACGCGVPAQQWYLSSAHKI